MRRRFVPVVAVACTSLLTGGCGGGGGDGFVAGRFESVPAAALEDGAVQIIVTDLARLADLTGAAAPDASRTGDELVTWLGPMTFGSTIPGAPKLVGMLATPLGSVAAWPQAEAVEAATGIALGGVETIISVDSPPGSFTVMTGDIALADSLVDVGDGVVSYGDGEDLAIGEPETWNQLGAPVRFATRDGAIAWSRTTDLAAEFAAGVDASLADDPVYGALAAALDEYDVASALLIGQDFRRQATSGTPDVAPFSAVGVGATVIDDEARTIVVYAFEDDDAAAGAVDVLADAWTDGADAEGRPDR